MYISRSLLASAIVLSLSSSGDASVLHRKPNGDLPRVQRRWSLPSLFGKRQGVEELQCPETSFGDLLNANPEQRVQSFCNDWLDISPTTVVVEYTPTSTSTTSADSTTTVTSITRVIETETLFVEATTTPAPMVPRWVNMANMAEASEIDSIANDIVQSVIVSGTTSVVDAAETTSKSPKRVAAEEGLATACSCKMVAPTSTVTVSFALPAVTTTVGYRRIVVSSETETRTFTSTTTMDAIPRSESTAVPTSSSTDTASASSTDTASASSTGTASASSAEQVTSTAPITATPIGTAVVSSAANPASALAPVVTAIPFACPDAHNTHIDQVAGGFRLDYLILCDTALEGEDRIGAPIPVDSDNACAAQCSLINAASGEDTCQTASYVPNADSAGGLCSIHGSQRAIIDSPGSVTIIHTGTFGNGDECAALSASPSSIDTSALVASVTSAGVSLSTPGLVTSTSGGGEFHTYVSANSTDPAGNVHWSWYQVDAASMNWWAVYRTSWACTISYTRTIEQAASTIEGSTAIVVDVTTIIGGGETTIIAGNETSTRTGGSGVATPTFVSASTTSANGEFTTFFSTAVEASAAASGVATPSATPTASVSNVTVTSVIEGSAAVTLSGISAVVSSTGGAGVIPPSSSAETSVPVSSAAAPVQESGSAAITVSGAESVISSTGAEGVVSPSTTGGSAGLTISGSLASANSTGGQGVISPSTTAGSAEVTVSGEASSASSTGGAGVESPSVPANTTVSSTPSSEPSSTADSEEWDEESSYGRPNQPTRTSSASVTSGGAVFTLSIGTTVSSSTGANGVITPTLVTEATILASESSTPEAVNSTALPTQVVVEGSAAVTIENSTSTAFSTGGSGVVSPSPVVVVEGSAAVTIENATSTAFSTGGSGVVSPSPVVVVEGSAAVTIENATSTAFSTGGSGVVSPSPTLVVVSTISGAQNLTLSGAVSTINSTGGAGVISVPTTVVVTETESLPLVAVSTLAAAANFTVEGGSVVLVSTGDSGVFSPIETTEVAPSATLPPASLNSTTTLTVFTTLNATSTSTSSTEILSSTGDNRTGGFSRPPTASESVPAPTFNATTEVPASATLPPASLNSTITVTVLSTLNTTSTSTASTEVLSSTGDDRTGGFSRPPTASVSVPAPTLNATTEIPPSATLPPASLNSTYTVTVLSTLNTTSPSTASTEILSSTGDNRTGGFSRPPTASESVPAPTFNATTEVPASATPPPVSLNSTTTLTVLTVLNTTSTASTEILSSTGDNRTGGFSRPPTASVSVPAPTFNATTGAPASVTPPPVSFNSTTTVPVVLNTTTEILSSTGDDRTGGFSRSTVASGSGFLPVASSNVTTTIAPSVTPPPVSLNSTTTVLIALNTTTEILSSTGDDRTGGFSRPPTASASVPIPTLNATTTIAPSVTPPPVSLNSTTTAPVVLNGTTEILSSTGDDRTGGFSRSTVASGSGFLPVPSSNATTQVAPQSTVVVTVSSVLSQPTPFVNTTAPVTASLVVPPASANSTGFLPTGTSFTAQGFSATVTVIVNSTLSVPLPTGNLTLIPPVTTKYPSNSTGIVPTPTGNITFPVLTTGAPLVSVNYSTVSSFSVGNISTILPTPSTSLEITSSAALPIGNLTIPSATPSASLNSTVPLFPTSNSTLLINSTISEACPTATAFSVRTRVAIITTTIIETIPVGPSTCFTTGAALPTGNLTFPTVTGLAIALPTATTEPVSLFRRADTPATPEQIEAACAESGNVLVAPNLAIVADESVPGWTVNGTESNTSVSSQTTPDFDGQIAQFRSADPGATLTIEQPLTLCPDQQYEVSALTQQPNVLSKCTVVFLVDNAPVFTTIPLSSWGEQSGTFTAGSGTAGASPILQVEASCAGQVGAAAGVDADGFMLVNVGNVTVTATSAK